jgi:ribonuclease HI
MPWARFLFKNQQRVFARLDNAGNLQKEGHLIEIRYQPEGKSYKAQAANLSEHPEGKGELLLDPSPSTAESQTPPGAVAPPSPKGEGQTPASSAAPTLTGEGSQHQVGSNEVIIYADGACSGNPGPAGIGVYLHDSRGEQEVSEYLGQGTNNIAELVAIQRALELCPDKGALIKIHTDSAYSIGVLTQNWKAKANQELILAIRAQLRGFATVKFIKVAGHAGIPGNERADMLARRAVTGK